MTLAQQKLEVGPDRRDVAPNGCRSEAEVLEVLQVLAVHPRRYMGRCRRALAGGVCDEPRDIAVIGGLCFPSRALHERQKVLERLDEEAPVSGRGRRGSHAARR